MQYFFWLKLKESLPNQLAVYQFLFYKKWFEQGKIDKNDKVVCYVTGNGLKATESIMQVLSKPTVYKPNINEISAVVQ